MEELRLFPSDEARHKAVNDVSHGTGPLGLTQGIIIMAGVTIAAAIAARVLCRSLLAGKVPMILLEFVPVAVAALTAFITLRVLHRSGMRAGIRRKLLDCGVPVCLKCGYDLRGMPPAATTCPECGENVSSDAARLLQSEPRHP